MSGIRMVCWARAGKLSCVVEPTLGQVWMAGVLVELRGQNGNALDGVSEAVNLGVDFLAKVFPNRIRHVKEDAHDFRIKLPSGEALYFVASHRNGLRRSVWPIGGNGVQRIGDREN